MITTPYKTHPVYTRLAHEGNVKAFRRFQWFTLLVIRHTVNSLIIFFSVLLGTQGAFTLIFVALVIMGITHYVSLKQDLMLTDNAAFNMLAVSYLFFYLLAQLGISIIIRIANAL